MAKQIKNIVELSKETPIFTILNTEEKGKDVLLLKTNTGDHFIGLDLSVKGEVSVVYDEVMAHSKPQLLALLKEIDNVFDSGNVSYTEKSKPLSAFPALSKTDTTKLYNKGFKILSETSVIKSLDEAGINHDNLIYKVVKLTNEHNSIQDARALYKTKMSSPVLEEWEEDLVDQIKSGVIKNISLIGPAGVGKTEWVKKICNVLNYTLEQRQNSLGVELDDIVGGIGVNTDEDSTRTYVKKDGLLTNSDQENHAGFVDEINMGDTRVSASFNNFCDESGYYTDINGVKHYRHENYLFFIAFNPGYDATSPLNQAFLDRFEHIEFAELDKDKVLDWLSIYGFKNDKFLDALYTAFDKCRETFRNRNFKSEVTFRGLKRFVEKLIVRMDSGKTITLDVVKNFFNNAILTKAMASEDVQYSSELKELASVSEVWCKDIYNALKEGEDTEEVEGVVELEQSVSLDDLGDFSSFSDIPMTDEGIPVEKEEE